MNKLPDDVVGGVGNLIAVILETAGLHAQADILLYFQPAFKSVGALFYIWAIVGALFSVAVWGNYKKGLFLLVCPPLFWWMLQTHEKTRGAVHMFGDRILESSEELKNEILDSNKLRRAESAEVSFFFKRFDRLVTSVIQQTVTLLVDTSNQQDLINQGREIAYRRLTSLQHWDSNYMNLLGHGLIGTCHEMAQLQFELVSSEYQYIHKSPDDACTIIRTENGKQIPISDIEAVKKKNELEWEYLLKCKNLKALKKKKIKVHNSIAPYIEDLGSTKKYGDGMHVCGDVWEWIRLASVKYAQEIWENPEHQDFAKKHPEIDWKRVFIDVQKKFQAPKSNDNKIPIDNEANLKEATEVLAAFIFRNTMAQSPIGSIGVSQTGRGNWDPSLWRDDIAPIWDNEGRVQRLLIFHFAALVPYMQGLILYLLSIAFPFFCFFLLIPDRVPSFFIWMSLWFWVKSWDVGFAFVHFFRELYWGLMPHLGYQRDLSTVNSFKWDPDKPEMMLSIVLRNDPGANIVTYYAIVSALTLAIPFVTAHLCMGATNLYDSLKTGIDGTANRFLGDSRRGLNRRYADRRERARQDIQKATALATENAMRQKLSRRPDLSQAAKQRAIDREVSYQLYKLGHSDKGMRIHQQLAIATGRLDPLQMLRSRGGLESVVGAMASELNDRDHYATHNLGLQDAEKTGFYESMAASDDSYLANTKAQNNSPNFKSPASVANLGDLDDPDSGGDADGD